MSKPPVIYLIAHHAVGPKARFIEYLPFGIMYVGQALMDVGFRVKLFHLGFGEEIKLLDAVADERPLFTGFTTMAWRPLQESIRISGLLHDMGITVVWGGVYASMVPETALAADYVDVVVQGEGELSAVELAERLRDGQDLAGIPGVGYKQDGQIIIEPPALPLKDLDKYRPAWELIDLERYVMHAPAIGITSMVFPISRGCPYNCTFCYNVTDKKQRRVRFHSPEWAAEQLHYLKKRLPIDTLGLIGDNPFGNPRKGMHLLESLGLRWTAHCRVDMFDEEFVGWLDEARCHALYLGIESGSDKMLKFLKKETTREQIIEGLEMLGRSSVLAKCGYMILLPGETDQDRAQTRSLIDLLHRINPRTGHGMGVFRPYPRTFIWQDWLDMGGEIPASNQEWSVEDPPTLAAFGKSVKWWNTQERLMNGLYSQPLIQSGSNMSNAARNVLRGIWLKGRFGPLVRTAMQLRNRLS